jgi:hypothetical protein
VEGGGVHLVNSELFPGPDFLLAVGTEVSVVAV